MMHRCVARACAVAALAFFAVALVACGDGDEDGEPTRSAGDTPSPTLEASPTGEPSPVGDPTGTAPPDRNVTTGIRSVDQAVAAVLAADEAAVRSQIVFQPIPCVVEQVGIGAPPLCRAGEADGTPVDVLPSAQCEGFYVRPDELQLEAVVPASAQLYAVYRLSEGYFPPGQYSAVFVAGSDARPPVGAYEIILGNEGIVGINYGCAEDAAQLVETRQLTDALVPPE